MAKISVRRLYNQRLEGTKFHTPGDAVSWLVAVQAQDYAGAKWALKLRTEGVTDDDIEQAFTDGAILRTHLMRPTWHFVTPADIRWLLALTAPRVHAVNAYMYRQFGMDESVFPHCNAAITDALQGGKQVTRPELGLALQKAGIHAEGQHLSYIMMQAELNGVICSGARRGKQFTYTLLEERVPQTRTLTREEALTELVSRYFTSRGPATIQDFTWWSGLTVADAKEGLAMVASQLDCEVIEDKTYWFSATTPPPKDSSEMGFFLPTYDEYFLGYADRSAALEVPQAKSMWADENFRFDSMIVIGGQVVGTWRRTLRKDAVVIETSYFSPPTAAECELLDAAQQRFREYLGVARIENG